MSDANIRSAIKEPRPLRTIITGTVCVTFFCFIIIFMSVFYVNMTGMLKQAESEHMLEVGAIMRDVVTANLENLRSHTRTWSSRDDTYEFAITQGESPIDESIADGSALEALGSDYVIIKDLEGNDLFTGSKSGSKDGLPDGLNARVASISAEVLSRLTTKSGTVYGCCDTGFVVADGRAYMVCVAPVLTSGEDSIPAGTFAFIKNFDEKWSGEFIRVHDTQVSVEEQTPENHFEEDFVTVEDNNTISLTAFVANLGGGRGAFISFYMPRTIYSRGIRIIILVSVVTAILLLCVWAALLMILDRYLLRPIAKCKADLARVNRNEMLNPDDYSQYRELYLLAHTINDAIYRLERAYYRERKTEISLGAVTSILNGIDAFIYVTDPETDEILFMNERMKAHYGIEGDPSGEVCWRLLHIGKSARCEFCPCRILESNPDNVQVWETYSDMTGRIHRNTDVIIEWVGGKKAHLQHIVDITEEKDAEEALKRRLSQQALMSELSQNFLICDDFDAQINRALKLAGEFMDAGRVLLCKFSEDRQSFTGVNEWLSSDPHWKLSPCLDIKIEIDERDSFITDDLVSRNTQIVNSDEMKGVLSKTYIDDNDYLFAPVYVSGELWGLLDVCGNKRVKWTESEVSLVILMSGIISAAVDHRLIEKKLRTMSSIVQYSPQFICYVDKDAEIKYVNPAVLPTTGYSEQEFMEKGFSSLFDESTFVWIRDELLPDILQNGAKPFEVESIRKDGSRRLWAVSGFAVGDGSGYVGGIAHDVTEIRRLERELISAKELAEQGSRAKGEFLSRMSHEMRTPMNAIIGMTNIAKASGDIAKKEYCLDKIENASLHLLGVINDVLDMSKIEADKFELSPCEFAFEHMLTNVINVIGFKMDEKSQNLSVVVDPEIPALLIGDEQRLNQIIINLLTNAVKFTPENGNISLAFKLLEKRRDDLHLEIRVTDDGIGISPEQQKKLFHSFEQADSGISRKFGGTGLGLVISKRIIQLMDGDIHIESEAGKGSAFIFDIHAKPCATNDLEPDDGNSADINSVNETVYSFAGKTALLAEDVDVNREIVAAILEDTQIQIDDAENGLQAIQLFERDPDRYDVIIMDVHMPEMDGLEATRRIRDMGFDKARKIPIIAMTANVFREDIEECLNAGMDDHVGKPIDFNEMLSKLGKYLS